MDDSLQNLENELKALRPRRPSALLRARVEHELAPEAQGAAAADTPAPVIRTAVDAAEIRRYASATTLRSWKWFSWQMAAAAGVALVVSLGVWRFVAPSPAQDEVDATALANTASVDDQSLAPRALSSPASNRAIAARTAPDAFQPVKAANVLYDVRDEGVVFLEDNTPARAVRARYVDTYTWKNPATNASLKWSVPRDEVRVLPASFH